MAVVLQIGAQQSFGAQGCSFGTETALQLAGSASQTVPYGLFMILCSANDEVQYTPDAGSTYRTVIAPSGFGVIFSDGYNVRILNTGVADAGGVKTYYAQVKAILGT